ncbi:MAG: YhgE/Pip domain-containing protein [Mogibacterium sp.]|nr:YhgE/Pip domain-containing protein [Mogibacterium sp.]
MAISVLPALYAWVNIYANMNPYGNTGNIKIALASNDPGLTLDDGTYVNMANDVFDEMRGSDKISWQFPESADEAIEGVKSGEYYAAIIFEDNFTYNMYHFEQALLDPKAPLKYYENTKANAVAPKITETAAETLQDSIKTKYLETVFSTIFDDTNKLAEELENGDTVDMVISQLEDLRDNLLAYDSAISSFISNSKALESGIARTSGRLDSTKASIRKSRAEAKAEAAKAKASIEALKKALEERAQFIPPEEDTQIASIESTIKELESALNQLTPIASSISSMLDSIDPVLDSAGTTVGAMDGSLAQMQKVIRASADDIDDIISKIRAADENSKIEMLADLLGGDPEEYAEFFSSLVNVEVEEIYSVASYGAAMAPFYSVLAIWVGGVVLVSILKTHIDRKKFPDATEAEAFFGKFLIFFLIGQLQAGIIVAGDIFLLDCQPVHPWLMWLSAAVTSLVFVLLIYALTISFGDVGKAIVVVIMVLQIAGSSGSYPIEILPPVFGNIYKFFPFPHAINAMREALCGMYRYDFVRYLAYLLIFGAAALAIGLLVRKPFLGMNRFVSEKIEETEVL